MGAQSLLPIGNYSQGDPFETLQFFAILVAVALGPFYSEILRYFPRTDAGGIGSKMLEELIVSLSVQLVQRRSGRECFFRLLKLPLHPFLSSTEESPKEIYDICFS